MAVVLSIGGSLLTNVDKIREWSDFVGSRREEKMVVVIGGGALARDQIRKARDLGGSEFLCDRVGILATRLNSELLLAGLTKEGRERTYPVVASDVEEAVAALGSYDTVLLSGTSPGHTTDCVAAMAAENLRSELLVVTCVDGVYDRDPERHKDAKLLEEIHADDLVSGDLSAGSRSPLDPVAAMVISRSKIPTKILNGEDKENLKRALEGKGFRGTRVLFS
jgi:uridylate kinase